MASVSDRLRLRPPATTGMGGPTGAPTIVSLPGAAEAAATSTARVLTGRVLTGRAGHHRRTPPVRPAAVTTPGYPTNPATVTGW